MMCLTCVGAIPSNAGVAYERLGNSAAAEQQNGTATFATLSATSTALANFLQSRPYAIDVLPPAGALTPIEPQENLIAGLCAGRSSSGQAAGAESWPSL